MQISYHQLIQLISSSRLFYTLLVLTLFISLSSNSQVKQITLEDVKEIADRNAGEMWGNIDTDDPIPYYGPDDEIIAYQFNYAIDAEFPEKRTLLNRCKEELQQGNRDLAWGNDDYANMVIGAKPYMPVFIEYSKCLSNQYALGSKLEETAESEFGTGYKWEKTYYFGYVEVWFCVTKNNVKKYINLLPAVKVLEEEKFWEYASTIDCFWTNNNFDDDWEKFLNDKNPVESGTVYIPGLDKMPFLHWSYGCTPTAAAMVLAWWDNYVNFGNCVRYYMTRYDPVLEEFVHHVPDVQRTLADEMNTSSGGTTQPGDMDNGIISTVTDMGYNCTANNHWWPIYSEAELYDDIKTAIDNNKPLLAHIYKHSITGIGYNDNTNTFQFKDPNYGSLKSLNYTALWGTTSVHISNDWAGAQIQLASPQGDSAYDTQGTDYESAYSNDFMEIKWNSDFDPDKYVKLWYHTEGGFTFNDWEIITSNTPNDGVYNWHVPEISCYWGNSTDYARIKIELWDDVGIALARDGSFGNFQINSGGNLLELNGLELSGTSPDYYSIPVQEEWWMVAGVRGNSLTNFWDMELYNNPDIFSIVLEESNWFELVNYIVINGHGAPLQEYGIKVMDNVEEMAFVQFDLNEDNLTPNSSNDLNWSSNNVVKMWDIHLTPGNYYFEMEMNENWLDLDMALFRSGGDNIFSREGAVAESSNVGIGVTESFHYNVITEGDYGLCVNSNNNNGNNYNITILDAVRWTGNVSTNWHLAANWGGNVVPGQDHNVVIKSGCPNYPSISFADAYCKNMTIESGATLKLYDRYLNVYGDLNIFGELRLESDDSFLTVENGITWEAGSSAYIAFDGATIDCYQSWYFNEGANVQLDQGTVNFITTNESFILSNDGSSYFNNVVVDKTTGIFLHHVLSSNDLVINGDLDIQAGSNLSSSSEKTIEIMGSFLHDGSVTLDKGTIRFVGDGKLINMSSGDYFHNLTLFTTSTSIIFSDLHLGGDFKITGGGALASADIYIAGNWLNYIGPDYFAESNKKVVFNGDGKSYINTSEEFNTLELNGSGELHLDANNVTCESYDWESGTLFMESGTFTINDLADNGIYGTIFVEDGTLNIHQDLGSMVDLNCELYMYGGVVNIYGGPGISYWSKDADTEILIDDGILDFKDADICFYNSSYALGGEIIGGIVRTAGSLICQGDYINIPGGAFELYGPGAAFLQCNGQQFYDLKINKEDSKSSISKPIKIDQGQKNSPPNNTKSTTTITAWTDITLGGDLQVSSGILLLSGHTLTVFEDIVIESEGTLHSGNGQVNIYGDWTNNNGAPGFTEGTGLVNFLGTESSMIYTDESFYNLEVNKSGDEFTYVTIEEDKTVTAFGDMTINACTFKLDIAATLNVLYDLTIAENANLYAHDYAPTYINIGTMWFNYNTTGYPWANGFNIGMSTVTFNGQYDDQFIEAATGNQDFYNLKINKPISGGGTFMPIDDITVYNDTEIVQGKWENDATGLDFSFYGDLEIQADGSWDDNVNTVNFVGPEEQWCINHGVGNVYFDNLYVIKETGTGGNPIVNIDGGLHCYFLWIQVGELRLTSEYIGSDYRIKISEEGILNALDYSRIHMADQGIITVHGGGILRLIGNGVNNPEVSCIDGYYSLTVYNSGILEANNALFEYMNLDGINFMNDGIVSETHSLDNCEFRRGEPGGTLLTFNTDQTVDILNAYFPTNSWGSSNNVTKTTSTGDVTFVNSTGNYSGWDHENDPNSLIHWDGLDVDLDCYEFYEPISGNLGSAETVIVYLWNPGSFDVTNTPISYSVNGGPAVSEIITETIGAEWEYEFNATADLSQPGVYEIVAWIDHPLDQNPYNDTCFTTIQCYHPNLCVDNLYTYGCHLGEGIDDFSLNTINHLGTDCSNNGFGDFAFMSTDLEQNGSYLMEVNIAGGGMHVSVWIDMNDDFLFDPSEKFVDELSCPDQSVTYNTTINIPGSAPSGQHRMRVRAVKGTNFDACTIYARGEVHDYTVNIPGNAPQTFNMDLKVFLEGPFNGTDMTSDLTSVIPLSQPFNMAPWYYYGTEAVSSIPPGVVDWVLVDLRDASEAIYADPETVITRQAALLMNDGSIVDLDGSQLIEFTETIFNDLYVAIWHRNHLGVMSAFPPTKSVGTYIYDFTTASIKTYGSIQGAREISPGNWGMVSGDGNADGFVSTGDIYFDWGVKAGESGYNQADYNLDTQVDNSDKNENCLQNINYECQVPE